MKLSVPKSTLDKAIKSVSKAVPAKGIQPILNNILLVSDGSSLKLNATDLDFFIEATIPSNNQEQGAITLSARKLEEIVSKLEEDDVHIDVDQETKKAKLKCKKANFDLVGIDSEEFPQFAKPDDTTQSINLSKEQFTKIIDLVHIAASRYDLNNILGGVFFGIREEDLGDTKKVFFEVAATDGNRLASVEHELVNVEVTGASAKEVVVPLKVILDVQKILDTSVDEDISISFLGKQIVFKTQDRFIVSRLLEGVYPRYKQLIPQDSDKIAQIDRKEFLSCLDRVSVMANEITNLVQLSFSNGNLSIKSSNLDFGDAEDNIGIEYAGEDINIYFNVKYLIESLKAMDSNRVQLAMTQPLNPVVIKPVEDDSYLYLIMPIKHSS